MNFLKTIVALLLSLIFFISIIIIVGNIMTDKDILDILEGVIGTFFSFIGLYVMVAE